MMVPQLYLIHLVMRLKDYIPSPISLGLKKLPISLQAKGDPLEIYK
jgi:hypothetical protein